MTSDKDKLRHTVKQNVISAMLQWILTLCLVLCVLCLALGDSRWAFKPNIEVSFEELVNIFSPTLDVF